MMCEYLFPGHLNATQEEASVEPSSVLEHSTTYSIDCLFFLSLWLVLDGIVFGIALELVKQVFKVPFANVWPIVVVVIVRIWVLVRW